MSNRGEDHGRVGCSVGKCSDRHMTARLVIWMMTAVVAIGNLGFLAGYERCGFGPRDWLREWLNLTSSSGRFCRGTDTQCKVGGGVGTHRVMWQREGHFQVGDPAHMMV